jgi:outer membrane receptor for ferrienterochelin and colicins
VKVQLSVMVAELLNLSMYRVFLFISCFWSFVSFAQEKITVHISDKDRNVAIESATVNVYSKEPKQLISSVQADEAGEAIIEISSYPVEIEIRALGYDAEYIKISQAGSAHEYNIRLSKRFNSLNEVVVTGVPRPTRPKNALSVYKTISAATMKAQGAVSLDQAIANQLNLSMTNDGVLGPQFRMQGMGGDKVKILIDGMPVNGREAGNINLSQLSLYNAERVEIVQGPMSVVYGTDALGGVINLITKNSRKPYEINATANYESIGVYNLNVSGTRTIKRHSLTLGGARNYSAGWKYIDNTLPHRNLLFKPKEQYLGSINYGYRASSGFALRLASDLVKEKITNRGEAQISPFEGYAFDDYYRTTRSMTRLLLDGGPGKTGHWQMMNGYSYYQHLKNSYRKDLVSLTETPLSNSIQDTANFNEFSSRAGYDVKKRKFDLSLGYDVSYQTANSKKIPGGSKQMGDYALFGTAALPTLKDKLTVQAGLRVEHNSLYSSPITPSLNLLYKPKEHLQIRASYAKGFRAPTLKELYLTFIDQTHHVMGNAELKAETSDHLQLSLSSQLMEKQSNYAQLLITGYYNHTQNGIMLTPDNPDDSTSLNYTYRNISELKNTIGTVELEGQQENLHYKLGYSYIYTFEEKDQYSAFDAHEVNVNLQYYWKLPRLNFSFFNKFTGEQPSLLGNPDGSATYKGRQPAYDMMDMSVERKFLKSRLQLIVGVKNILNVQSLTPTGIVVSGAHSGNGLINYLPRRLFTSLNIALD